MRRGPLNITRPRVLQVASVVALCLMGVLLPYLTLAYLNYTVQLIRPTHALFGAANMLGLLNVSFLPVVEQADADALQPGVDLTHLAARAQHADQALLERIALVAV